MAAAPDRSVGFFSAVCSRLRAAWRHERGSDAASESEAAVRSRLARRAGSARRLGRSLAFVSVNLEVLLFVYAFWRARRRNLSWRKQPLQALPMLAIPALAALVYASFVRFTRTLDLKDRKTLQQQHHDSDDYKDQNAAKKCDSVDGATSVSSQSDLAETSKLHKHHQSSRDDGGGDRPWCRTNDFQPVHSDGLRRRIFSIKKTHKTSDIAFRQPNTWSSEYLSDAPEDPNYVHSTTENHSNSGTDDAENTTACSTADTGSFFPGCSITHLISSAMDHADFSPPISCPESNGCLAEEDAMQIELIGPKPDFPAVAELHHAVIENRSSSVHVSEDNMMPFLSDEELSVSLYTVQNTECNAESSAYTLFNQETDKEDVAESVCLVKVSYELSVLPSPELAVEGGKEDSRKESCELNREEEKDLVISSEEEGLLCMPAINTAEHCSGGSVFSLLAQDSDMMGVPAVLPASNYTASMELSAEDEGFMDDETSDVHLPEQRGQEAFMDPAVVDSFEDLSAMSEFLSHSAAAKITEAMGVVKEGLSEESCNHQNDVATSSDDGGNTENAMNDPVPIQLIPEANITGCLQDCQQTLSGPLYHSSSRSAGIFLSSSDISNDEDYSTKPNSYSLCANSVKNKEALVSQGGSESKDETDFAFLGSPILLNEAARVESCTDTAGYSQCIPESNKTQSLCGGKRVLPMTSESPNFGLEESLISPDQEINLEIFSLYSRSSSCVSEVNMIETLRVGTFPTLENNNDSSLDEKTSMMVPNLKHEVQYGTDLHSMVGSHFFSQNTSQDPLLFNETSFDPGNVSVSESNSDDAKLLLCSAEINLTESLDGDQRGTDQQQDEVDLFFEDIYMAHQGATSENRLDSLGYQHISDANMTETLQGAERLSSEILHDDILCKEKTSVSLDGRNDTDNSSSDPGSIMHTTQNNTVVLLGLQGLEKVMVSISQYEVDVVEQNGSDCIYTEASMTGAIQGVNKSPAQSHCEHPRTYFSTEKENHPEHLRSPPSMSDDNLIELLGAGPERPFDRKDENPSSFDETSLSENPSNNQMPASHNSKNESATSYRKGLPDPKLKVVDSFDKIHGDEQTNRSLKENALSFEQIARTRAEVNCSESQDFAEASNLNCTEASESFGEGFFEPEHQEGLELVVSQVGMPVLIDEGEETAKDHGRSSIACASSHHGINILETLQVLPVSAASEKGFLEGSKVCEWRCTDKEPKDPKVKDMKENIEDLDEDHENNPIGLLGGS